ncbi:MAG TPA: M14 family zinc carboxypeptidase [Thermoanaerobaculia bacterium]|nr:M14 family zinc carboxypeptidase [Thermoanaerobaculia bacterium]
MKLAKNCLLARSGVLPLLLAALLPFPARAEKSEPSRGDDPVFAASGFPSGLSLPKERRDAAVPEPHAFLGHRLGERFTAPEAIAGYARAVAAASPRVRVATYGETPEGRDLLLVTISSPTNLARLDSVRSTLQSLARGERNDAQIRREAESLPVVVWIAAGVHGNEASGPEAAVALLYLLAASNEERVLRDLDQAIVVLDPCVNPDGRARYVSWWRSVAGTRSDADPTSLENDEGWPQGRTSHEGFDLNRDWAWATQPETRARIAALLELPPAVYVDVHEMSPESSYFFPPDAEPVHSGFSERTRKWLERFGQANARAFDERGYDYFVREIYDLFYPAYGDSWPSFHGAVGMTYEMAGGGAGLTYRRKDGTVLTLKERVVKHLTALRTTVDTAASGRRELVLDFAAFFASAMKDGKRLFAVPAGQDPTRLSRLAELLARQGIRVERTTRAIKDPALPAGSLLVDTAQPLGRFAEALLEPTAALPKAFLDEERLRLLRDEPDGFFDVTAWSLPLSFGLSSLSTTDRAAFALAREPWPAAKAAAPEAAEARFGWLLPGDDFASRLAAARLAAQGVRLSFTTRPASLSGRAIPSGSFLLRRANNDRADLDETLLRALRESGAHPVPLAGAWTDSGPTFGSETVVPLKRPRIVLLTGEGADVGSAGAVALAVERDLGLDVVRRRASSLERADLSDVTAIVVPNGEGSFRRELERDECAAALRRFVENGGVVVGIRGGADVLRGKALHLSQGKVWEPPKDDASPSSTETKPAATPTPAPEPTAPKTNGGAGHAAAFVTSPEEPDLVRDLERRALRLPGAALKTRGLAGHPLLFGAPPDPIFLVLDDAPPKRLPGARTNVVTVVSKDPLAAGFAWKEALDRWSGAPIVQVEEVGRGKVVRFAGDPNFRGVWLGTEILFLNAVLLMPSL